MTSANESVADSDCMPASGSGDLLQGGYEVELLAVDDSADERALLSVANRLYWQGGPVDALQVVLPDQHYRFP
jgi:hypothetical protein